jgi:hypothetical protein
VRVLVGLIVSVSVNGGGGGSGTTVSLRKECLVTLFHMPTLLPLTPVPLPLLQARSYTVFHNTWSSATLTCLTRAQSTGYVPGRRALCIFFRFLIEIQ